MAATDALQQFTEAAATVGVTVDAVRYPAGTRTAVDAAIAVGCDVGQIVKSLVLTGPDGQVIVLTSGSNRVDLDALTVLLGGPVRMATPDEARAATGYPIGATPPFGHPARLTTLVDVALLVHETVYAAAGTSDSCFPIDPALLTSVTRASQADVFT